jgi:toxin CcdB
MSQFDVHRNPGANRAGIPYVVVVQSSVFDGFRRRVVVPLVRKSLVGTIHQPRLNPSFTVKGTSVVLNPLEIVSVPLEKLGKPVASLASHGAKISDALDELLSRVDG